MSSNIVPFGKMVPSQGQPLATVPRAQQQENPLLLLHRLLRGKYPLAITLAIILGVPGAIAGYLAVEPAYRSTGIVRVASTLPRLMYESEDNRLPPMFDSFVSTQATYLSSRRVLDMAMEDDDLRRAGWPGGIEGLSLLSRALKVNHRRGSELITVQVEDTSPRLAQAALNAVLAAYESLEDELNRGSTPDRETTLRNLQRDLQREIESLRAQIDAIARPYGTDDLDLIYTTRVSERLRLESLITDLEIQLASLGGDTAAPDPDATPDPIVDLAYEVEVERLAARDRTLAQLRAERLSVQAKINARAGKFGPGHRTMIDLTRQRDALDRSIEDRVAFLREHEIVSVASVDGPDSSGQSTSMTASQLRDLLSFHREMRDREAAAAMQVGNSRLTIMGLKDRLAERRRLYDDTTRALERLEVESLYASAGRISIAQRGDLQTTPAKDRRIPLAFFGAMSGAGIGVGFVVLLTLLQGGYRYIDDLERGEGPGALLGTVPDLSGGGPDHAALAALSVHHLRNMLQMNSPPTEHGTVYTISSAMAGDGKTSLALSLAMSFASMGNRTLLIDADLIGRGLSRQLTLSSAPGLSQALRAASLNGEVHATRVANLWAIPAGFDASSSPGPQNGPATGGIQPEQIAQSDLRRVLDLAREQFDTVIVDTGPILGSLEANLLAPMSDRVVLVVARGQSSKFVRSALDRISRLGAICGGLVFNRAEATDFDRSISAVSVSGRSLRDQASHRSTSPAPGTLALLDAVSSQHSDPQHAEPTQGRDRD